MVKVTVVGLVAVMGLLAGPMSAAHAGGMGIGSGGAYVCYLSSGASPGGGITLTDTFLDNRNVKIGVVRLICAPVNGTGYTGTRNLAPPAACDPGDPLTPCGDHLKCYDIRSSKGDNPVGGVTLNDYFNTETVAVGGSQVLCVGAQVVP